MKCLNFSIIFAALILPTTILATEPPDRRWRIAPTIGYVWGDSERGPQKDGGLAQVNIGQAINNSMDLDFRFQYLQLGSNQQQLGAGIEATWIHDRKAAISPLLNIGAGWVSNEINNKLEEGAFVFDIGVGLQAPLPEWDATLRSFIKQRADLSINPKGDFFDTIFTLSIRIPIGSQETSKPNVEPEVIAAKADIVQQAFDELKGPCSSENCEPNTPAADQTALTTIYFDSSSSELSSLAQTKMRKVAQLMVERKYIVAVVTGHADASGNTNHNIELSLERAIAVKSYLLELGVRSTNVIAKGVGEADPTSSNESRSGREQNRRVEVRLLDQ